MKATSIDSKMPRLRDHKQESEPTFQSLPLLAHHTVLDFLEPKEMAQTRLLTSSAYKVLVKPTDYKNPQLFAKQFLSDEKAYDIGLNQYQKAGITVYASVQRAACIALGKGLLTVKQLSQLQEEHLLTPLLSPKNLSYLAEINIESLLRTKVSFFMLDACFSHPIFREFLKLDPTLSLLKLSFRSNLCVKISLNNDSLALFKNGTFTTEKLLSLPSYDYLFILTDYFKRYPDETTRPIKAEDIWHVFKTGKNFNIERDKKCLVFALLLSEKGIQQILKDKIKFYQTAVEATDFSQISYNLDYWSFPQFSIREAHHRYFSASEFVALLKFLDAGIHEATKWSQHHTALQKPEKYIALHKAGITDVFSLSPDAIDILCTPRGVALLKEGIVGTTIMCADPEYRRIFDDKRVEAFKKIHPFLPPPTSYDEAPLTFVHPHITQLTTAQLQKAASPVALELLKRKVPLEVIAKASPKDLELLAENNNFKLFTNEELTDALQNASLRFRISRKDTKENRPVPMPQHILGFLASDDLKSIETTTKTWVDAYKKDSKNYPEIEKRKFLQNKTAYDLGKNELFPKERDLYNLGKLKKFACIAVGKKLITPEQIDTASRNGYLPTLLEQLARGKKLPINALLDCKWSTKDFKAIVSHRYFDAILDKDPELVTTTNIDTNLLLTMLNDEKCLVAFKQERITLQDIAQLPDPVFLPIVIDYLTSQPKGEPSKEAILTALQALKKLTALQNVDYNIASEFLKLILSEKGLNQLRDDDSDIQDVLIYSSYDAFKVKLLGNAGKAMQKQGYSLTSILQIAQENPQAIQLLNENFCLVQENTADIFIVPSDVKESKPLKFSEFRPLFKPNNLFQRVRNITSLIGQKLLHLGLSAKDICAASPESIELLGTGDNLELLQGENLTELLYNPPLLKIRISNKAFMQNFDLSVHSAVKNIDNLSGQNTILKKKTSWQNFKNFFKKK